MLKVLYVGTKGVSKEKDFGSVEEIKNAIGIKENTEWETMELEGVEGIGIIANDQDQSGLEKNRLGIKGDFVIVGMKRTTTKSGNLHAFSSLTDEQLSEMRISLAMQTYKDLSNM